MNRSWLRVYFIMGSNNTTRNPLEVLEEALQGGITMFQFREKGKNAYTGDMKLDLAQKMKQLCHQYNVPFIVNDDVDLAIAVNADGIHVGQDDAKVDVIKRTCPSDWIIGVSATNKDEAIQAMEDGADYIGVGPIYSTKTKSDAKKPIDIIGLAYIRQAVGDLPIVAIGGIGMTNVFPIIKAGADGVSIISAISNANNPRSVAQVFDAYTSYAVSFR
ncbi:thiamine phosphate synthase [Gracilibacillus marinus]|jgi:thiamine-phosphate pyrophosphorylase|uniref:Thiamine-phosphate synthase n=1 Tax=Gracilibacillus marinus TaxID=630535 RepID=A0ABV8VY40_9BACI